MTMISFHDFTKTPSFNVLKMIGMKMEEYNPHIKKIATMAKRKTNIHTLYRILIEKKRGKTIALSAWENLGNKFVSSPFLGGYFTYCSIKNGGSASGQMTCTKMKEIYKLMQ